MRLFSKILMTGGILAVLFALALIAGMGPIWNDSSLTNAVALWGAIAYLMPLGLISFLIGFFIWFRRYLKEKIAEARERKQRSMNGV